MKKPLVILILMLLAVVLSAGCIQEPQTPSAPRGITDVIPVNPQIDVLEPDAETARAFLISPTYNFVFNILMDYDEPDKIEDDILSQTLYDFPYSTADGEVIIQDITIGEFLSRIETVFAGHGWTGVYITCIIDEPRYTHDLENIYSFIQYIAKRDGFEKTIPLLFLEPLPPGVALLY